MSLLARLKQVRLYLSPHLKAQDLAWGHAQLNASQRALFVGLSLPDQAHALRVARRLEARRAPSYAIEAALLHDCGKPLGYNVFWRSLGVILSPLLKNLKATPKAQGALYWLQIYRWHDLYGLEMAEAACSSPEALELLRAYQTHEKEAPLWLGPLQECDDAG